jgi:hypothetical protein
MMQPMMMHMRDNVGDDAVKFTLSSEVRHRARLQGVLNASVPKGSSWECHM